MPNIWIDLLLSGKTVEKIKLETLQSVSCEATAPAPYVAHWRGVAHQVEITEKYEIMIKLADPHMLNWRYAGNSCKLS